MVTDEVYKANVAAARERLADVKAKRKVTKRLSQVKSLYGLGREQFLALLDDAGWECEICSKSLTIGGERGQGDSACIDHCHSSGKIRGVLCRTCNSAIGALGDTTGSVSKALVYLEKAALRET